MAAAEKMPEIPSSRGAAIAAGAAQYFTGKPCVYGHIANRFTSSGTCVDCNAIRARGVAAKLRQAGGGTVKLPSQLPNDPRLFNVARLLAANPASGLQALPPATMRTYAAGVLYRFAVYLYQHAPDGILHDADLGTLDFITETPGFGEAMASVGWAHFDAPSRTVTIPPLNSGTQG